MESFIDIGLWVAIVMVIVAALAAIVLPLINSISHPKSLIKTGVGVVGLAVLFLITWSVASSEVSNRYLDFGVNETTSKLIGGSLLLMYILFAVAILGIIFSEINKAFK